MQVSNSGSPFSVPVPSTNLIMNSSGNDPYNRTVILVSSDGKEFPIRLSLLKSFESLSNPFIDGIVGESLSLSLNSLTLEGLIDFFYNYNNPDQTFRWNSFRKGLLDNFFFTHKIEAEKEEGPEGNFLHELQSLYFFSESHLINGLSEFILRFIQNEDILNLYSQDSLETILNYLENPSDLQLPPYKILWYLAIKKALTNNDSEQIRNLFFYFIKHFGQEHLKLLIEPFDQREKLLFLFINKLLEELDNEASPECNLDSIFELLENCNFWNIFKNSSRTNVPPISPDQLQGACLQAKILEAISFNRPFIKPLTEQPKPTTKTTQFFILIKQLVNKVSNKEQAHQLMSKLIVKTLDLFDKQDLTELERVNYSKFFPFSNYQPNSRANRWSDIIFKQIFFSLISKNIDHKAAQPLLSSYFAHIIKLKNSNREFLRSFTLLFLQSFYQEFIKSRPCKLSEYLQRLNRFSRFTILSSNNFEQLVIGLKNPPGSRRDGPDITEVDLQNPEEAVKDLYHKLPAGLSFIMQEVVTALSSHVQISEETKAFFNKDGALQLNPVRLAASTVITSESSFFDQPNVSLKELLIPQKGKGGQSLRPLKRVHEAFDEQNLIRTLILLQEKERSKNTDLKAQFIESAIRRGDYDKAFELANTFEKSHRRTCLYLIFTSLYDKGDLEKFDELKSKLELFKDSDSQELSINLLLYATLEKHSAILDGKSELIQFVKEILIPKLQKLEERKENWDKTIVLVLLAKLLGSNDRLLMELIFEFANLKNIRPINKSKSESQKWHIQDFILSAKLYLGDKKYIVEAFRASRGFNYAKCIAKALRLNQQLAKNYPSNGMPILNPSMAELLCAHFKHLLTLKSSQNNADILGLFKYFSRELLLNIRHFEDKDPALAKKLFALVLEFKLTMIDDIDVISDLLLANFHLAENNDRVHAQILTHLLSQNQAGMNTISQEAIAAHLAVKLALGKEKYKKLFINLMNNLTLASLPEFAVTYYITLENTLPKKEFYLFMSEIPLPWDQACIAHFSFDLRNCRETYQRISESENASKNCFHHETFEEPQMLRDWKKRKRLEEEKEKEKTQPKTKKMHHETTSTKRKAQELGEKEKKKTPSKREKGKEKLPN